MALFRRVCRSIYMRLSLGFLAIVLPLLFMQIAMTRWGGDAVTQEMNSAAKSNVVYLRDSFVGSVQSINEQLEYLLSDYTITSFFVNHESLSTADYYVTAMNINNLLRLIKSSNPYLDEILLYYPDFETRLSSNDRIDVVTDEDFSAMIAEFRSQKSLLMERNGKLVVGRMYPATSYFKESRPKMFARATLSYDAIRNLLSSFSRYSNKNAFLYNHNTGSALVGADSIPIDPERSDALLSRITPTESGDVYSFSVNLDGGEYVAVACYARAFNCSFVQLIPAQNIKTIPDAFHRFVLIFCAFAFALICAYSFFTYRLVRRPMKDFIDAFAVAGTGDFDKRLPDHYSSEEYSQMARHFNTMTSRIKRLIETNYEQSMRLQRAEFKQLQAQINPHFLYNSFFCLRHMIGQKNDRQAMQFSTYLGRYFQYITKNGTDMVPLYMEYDHAMTYLDIQMIRFEDQLTSDIEPLPNEYGNVSVPRLILQPVIENFFIHGVKRASMEAIIRLRFVRESEERLHIVVSDNGNSLTDETLDQLRLSFAVDTALSTTSGLTNIDKRLRLHYGQGYGLNVSRGEMGGLRVDMTVNPKNGSKEETPCGSTDC